ncbi:DUF1249 domain-containing protein [Alteromonadaceae bacterium M269]|nr:DUF1249 domain-containing protein [Alteromonadaceae bacterium M269]
MLELNQHNKYVPNLPSLLAVCDANYGRLLKLLPDCDTEELIYHFDVSPELRYQIQIVECCRYTTSVEIRQIPNGSPAYLQPSMMVRLYHDASMAEVLSFQHMSQIKPSYQYPNSKMLHRNEKEQMNIFLAEWLCFCLENNKKQTPLTAE